jgi:hypothetical protein
MWAASLEVAHIYYAAKSRNRSISCSGNLLSIVLLAEGIGRHPFISFEEIDEVTGIQVPQFPGNGRNAVFRGAEHLLGNLHLLTVHIAGKALTNFSVKSP